MAGPGLGLAFVGAPQGTAGHPLLQRPARRGAGGFAPARCGAYARPMPAPRLSQLRDHAIARSLFQPTSLPQALARLGFVQADPLRAPARAQDLTLRHRVRGYRAGDLERRYTQLDVEEDFFINYGFMSAALHHLMHPRTARRTWTPARWRQADAVLAFVHERGVVHPREVDARFAHGRTLNWFGGSGRASTELLDGMHYRGLLRVARREAGTRLYAARVADRAALHSAPAPEPAAALDHLVDVLVAKYAPLPQRGLSMLVHMLANAVPQWTTQRPAALQRALARLPGAEVDGCHWLWPAGENPASRRHAHAAGAERVRLLAPFDPLVWDRPRFEQFWGWPYRFEAYTPAAKRLRGHYALPLLWRGSVVGWANATVVEGRLQVRPGYLGGQAPRDAAYAQAWQAEQQALADFLGLPLGG